MNNELVTYHSFWKRHRKKLLVTFLFLGMLLTIFFTSGFGGVVGDFTKAYGETALFANAIEQVNENALVQETLGTVGPLDKMAILEGQTTFSDDNEFVEATVLITGTKGKAVMDINANLVDDVWQYSLIRVRIKNPPEKKQIIPIIPLD